MALFDAIASGGSALSAWGPAISVGASLIGGLFGSNKEKNAQKAAAAQQQESIRLAIEDKKRQYGESSQQFKEFREMAEGALQPYQQAGTDALEQQRDLAGLNGPERQKAAQAAISGGGAFNAIAGQGEDAILQNASATGGLRGGNTQGALAQFRPQLLQQFMEQQYNRLGGLAGQGFSATQQRVNLPWQAPQLDLSELYLGGGRSAAGATLAGGASDVNKYGGIAGAVGQLAGLDYGKLFGGVSPPKPEFSPSLSIGKNLDLSFLRAR